MNDFLYHVAQDILQKYGTDLSRTAVVFPNKRASLFLNEHLAKMAGKPLWSPAYITISELFRNHSNLVVADPIKLVCDLHKSFCQQTGSTETLDQFYAWGQLLLADFDDIDKNMADVDRVFANIRDIHELDDLDYLSPEQRTLLHHFFSHFSEEHVTELKQRFLRLWSRLADIYHDFNQRLQAQGLCYEGALYRQVAEGEELPSDYDHYLFVGFNLLQKVEQQLFLRLQREQKACFYWDFDHYYMQHHEAGRYIARHLQIFPNELPAEAEDIYQNFQHPKNITFVSAPSDDLQARYVSRWLTENDSTRLKGGRRTAIVLCDESLLPTVIHCLPDEARQVNITTGYPLQQTTVASFIQLYLDMLLGGCSPRLKARFQRHPYAKYIDNTPTEEKGICAPLLTMLRSIAQHADISDPLFQESVYRAYTTINRLHTLIESGDLVVTDSTLVRLIHQVMQQVSIPYHGEPAVGLQIMGVLETRNLDFDHVLLLSCNDSNMPRGVSDTSFIPHSIRHAYELTTIENKVGIYSYYFHRLLQRAHDVTIVYNNATDDGQQGEMSRFMLQLMVEYPHPILRHTLLSGQQVTQWNPVAIPKTPRVVSILNQLYGRPDSTLSPTAVNLYLRCPLQFYYRYVADIRQPETPDEEQGLDNRIFGNVFHQAADIIYKQLPADIERPMLDHLLRQPATIERAVDEAFQRELPSLPQSGLQIINREVIIRYLRILIEHDRTLAPFRILGLEYDVRRQLNTNLPDYPSLLMGGRIDRLDLVGAGTPQERIRVVDYKTGSYRMKALPDVDAIFAPEQIHNHSDYYLQTFVYADIVSLLPPSSFHLPPSTLHLPVSPALLFIQHAAAPDYNPTLCFGKEPILDIAPYSQRFNELLVQTVGRILSPDEAFQPTADQRTCQRCPYRPLCRR